MKPFSVSVVLCTYNGMAFLQEQLDSISQQTRPPNEVLLRDDRSLDNTLKIAHQWASAVSFPVRTTVNAVNLGSTRNFAAGIEASAGDIIVLCDQDDVWLPQKLEKITHYFTRDAAAEAIFTDGWVVDQSLNRQRLLSQEVGFRGTTITEDIQSGRILRRLSTQTLATGATMALRAELRSSIFPLPERLPRWLIHDGWIALAAALRGTLRFLEDPLILYRQHAGQQVGLASTPAGSSGRPRMRGAARREVLARFAEDTSLLAKALHTRFPNETAKLTPFDDIEMHAQARHRLPTAWQRRILPTASELLAGRYHRYAKGWRTFLADVLG